MIVRKSWKRTLMVIGPAGQPVCAQPAARPRRPCAPTPVPAPRRVVQVAGERLLVADRLQAAGRARRPGRRSPREQVEVAAVRLARARRPASSSGSAARSPTVATPEAPQPLEGRRADAPQRLDRQRVEERQLLARARRPSRRGPAARPGRATPWAWPPRTPAWRAAWSARRPTEHVSPSSSRTSRADERGDRSAPSPNSRRAPVTSRKASSRAMRLDERRERAEDRRGPAR